MMPRAAAQPSVAAGFDAAAERYDAEWTDSSVGRWQREAVWRALDGVFRSGERILDLGCGTGADAVRLARAGVRVHAVDVSPRMLDQARRRALDAGVPGVTFELGAIENLARSSVVGPFDGALSNFGALDCVADIAPVGARVAAIVRPGGTFAISVFGRFCAWEVAWYLLRGDPARAFRRLRAAPARPTAGFAVSYRSVRHLEAALAPHFRLVSQRGIGVAVPPSYTESWARRHPRLLAALAAVDRFAGACPAVRGWADHRLLVFVRRT